MVSRIYPHPRVAACSRHGIYIISDEVYRMLEHDPKNRIPAMAGLYRR